MYCPRCGQQQATDSMRFCSRCGFPMEGAMHLLANGGLIPQYQHDVAPKGPSPRKKGVRQGATLMLIGAILVPILAVMAGFAPGRLENVFGFFCALAAIICFLGGPLRMLFAGIFEEGAPPPQFMRPISYSPPMVAAQQARVSLPPAQANPASSWRQPHTAEILQPPSVTDNTTRLLEKKESEGE
ncbi:MAG: hypothetical protein AABM67_17860 [Acidobacteriota bacterium]